MITEDYVSFEVAKLLKGKGFPLSSTNFEDWVFCMYDKNGNITWGCYHPDYYVRVTLQMAMKWLREVHKIYIDINIHIILEQWAGYDINIYTTNTNDCLLDKVISCKNLKDNISYEQACEAAIKYCLENLI